MTAKRAATTIMGLAMLLAFAGCGEKKVQSPVSMDVTYLIEGSNDYSTATVTYTIEPGRSQTVEDVALPWTTTVKAMKPSRVVLYAENPRGGMLSCSIEVDKDASEYMGGGTHLMSPDDVDCKLGPNPR